MTTYARIVFLSLFIGSSAWAGGMEAGGGYGFTCFANVEQAQLVIQNKYKVPNELVGQITEIIPQDLYVSQQFAEKTNSKMFEPRSSDLKGMLDEYLQHFATVSKPLAEKMTSILYGLDQNKVLMKPDIPHPNDHGTFFTNEKGIIVIDGQHCVRVAIAVQFLGEPPTIHFNQMLFEHPKMDARDQAVLWLHELLYVYARSERGFTSSEKVTISLTYLLNEGAFSNEKVEQALKAINML